MNRYLRLAMMAMMVAMVCAAAAPVHAQDWRVVPDHEWCEKASGACETREITMAAWGDVDVRTVNGSIRVEGWDRPDVQVIARIQVSGKSADAGDPVIREVKLFAGPNGIRATGPTKKGVWRSGPRWSVSFRVMVPSGTTLAANTTNGAIEIANVAGAIEFSTTNGSVKVENASGTVSGGTTNGAIDVAVATQGWKGDGIDVHTTNGGISVALPRSFSADLDARTVNGGIRVEHEIQIREKTSRRLEATLNGGGAPLRLQTTNGRVKVGCNDL